LNCEAGKDRIATSMCVGITVAMVMLLRDFGPYGIIFMTVFTALDFPVILDGQFTVCVLLVV
jgi:hypothetical protein